MSLAVLNRAKSTTSVLSTLAYGKINLTLEVLGRRSDDYHEIRSVSMCVDLSDRVYCGLTTESNVQIECADQTLATPENLACRAARLFQKHTGLETGFEIRLEKNIPIGGGMGGGSSDAAATLRLCNELCGTNLARNELAALGARIGSDVPLFFHLPSALLRGRGEVVESFPLAWRGWVLLVFVDAFVSTPLVYRTWSQRKIPRQPVDIQAMAMCKRARELDRFLVNELEEAVFKVSPEVANVFRTFETSEVGSFRVSGAGSTLYRLFDDEVEARRVAGIIGSLNLNLRTIVAAGPVGEHPLSIEEN